MTKEEVRKEARGRLRAMTATERSERGKRAAAEVWKVPEIVSARTLLIYASLPEELPTDEIAREARARGIEVVYPRCLVDEVSMTLHRVGSEDELVVDGRFGLREPPLHCPLTAVSRIDVALIPGLGWDRSGARIGRGAGYYDRLLAHPEWRALRCGLFFALQEFRAIPMDPLDSPLDLVVTDQGVSRF